jgi:hypothetical protein
MSSVNTINAPSDTSALYASSDTSNKGRADDLALDLTQAALDIAGIFDPTGAADAASGVISLSRGDWLGAGISAVGALLPYAGDTAKLGKLPKLMGTVDEAIALAKESPALAMKFEKSFLALSNILHRVDASALPAQIGQAIETLRDKVDKFFSSSGASSPQPPEDPKGKGKKGGDHLVNSGFGQTLSQLNAPQGNSRVTQALDQLRNAVHQTDSIRVNKGAGVDDANSLAYGRAQQTLKNTWANMEKVLNNPNTSSAQRSYAVDAVVKSLDDVKRVVLDPEVARQAVQNKVISRAQLNDIASNLDTNFDKLISSLRALAPRNH